MQKLIFNLLITLASAVFFIHVQAQKVPCPPEGGPKRGGHPLTEEKKELNRKKNRSAAEPGTDPVVLSIKDLLQGKKPVKDRHDFKEGTYVEINDGYMMDFEEKGPEDCNCHLAQKKKATGDVHIVLCTQGNLEKEDNDFTLVVEITPSYKALHHGYTSTLNKLKGKMVTVRGYLFYDDDHEGNSLNYCKTCTKKVVWRKTCWEIHPVTYIGKQ